MSSKKTRNKHKNTPSKRKMLKMNKILTEKFGLEESEEIPHMRNYYLSSLKEMLDEKKRKIKEKRKEKNNG